MSVWWRRVGMPGQLGDEAPVDGALLGVVQRPPALLRGGGLSARGGR